MSLHPMINLGEKTENNWSYLATFKQFFECRIFILGLLKLNIKPGQDMPDFLNQTVVNTYYNSIGHGMELKYFLFAQFWLNAH